MPTAVLTPTQAAAKARYDAGHALLGHYLGQALKVMAKDVTLTDTAEVKEFLRTGPTIRINCSSGPRRPWRSHRATLNTDGTVTLHHHPEVDLTGELVMGALAETMPACFAAAMFLPDRDTAPSWFRGGRQSLEARLRPLHTAVQWAQDPDTDWSWLKDTQIVRMGVTPSVLDEWTSAGFTFEQALPFWDAMAPLDVAQAWLESGETTKRAATLAGKGQTPDADRVWLAAGFTKAKIAPWRNAGIDPVEAIEWARRGLGVSDHKQVRSTWAQQAGYTREVAFEWADNGMPGNIVTAWWAKTQGDFEQALPWALTGLQTHHLGLVTNPTEHLRDPATGTWYHHSYGPGLSVQRVQEWADAGFPINEARLLVSCEKSGISPVEFFQKFGQHRLRGVDLRNAMQREYGRVPDLSHLR